MDLDDQDDTEDDYNAKKQKHTINSVSLVVL